MFLFMNYKKLIGIATAVTTITGYTFAFNSYQSEDGAIRRGVDKLKEIALGYKADLEKLQTQYDALMGNLESTQDALAQARLKLKQIYMKITGQEWDEATQGDILEFDFDTLLKDGEQFDNNVDGDAIADILGLEHGATTEQIIAKIQELIATVQSLEQRIEQLESQVDDLKAEIAEYETEQDSLVAEINGLKAKLDEATAQANAIINSANEEQQDQLDYVNDTLESLGEDRIIGDVELNTAREAVDTAWANFKAQATANRGSYDDTIGQANEIKNGEFSFIEGNTSIVKTTSSNYTLKAGEYDLLVAYRSALDNYFTLGGTL